MLQRWHSRRSRCNLCCFVAEIRDEKEHDSQKAGHDAEIGDDRQRRVFGQ
jgi:hypothetical protein